MECRKQKKREWQIRMNEEIKHDRTGKFITLTFSNEELEKLIQETGIQESNAVATIAVRRFLERIRKQTGKSVKHWFITELGHENTERLHLHGIVWGIGNDKVLTEKWKYGITWTGYFVNEKTIQYITKYMTKIDEQHKDFTGKVLCSKGIGKGYTERIIALIAF